MLDTMTLTKAGGAACGALLIFLLGNWAGDLLYSTGGGHGDEHAAGYVIQVEGGESGAAAEAGPDFATLMASADVEKGAKVFGKCKACHKLEAGAQGTGPTLFGVVGRGVEAEAGFGYSGALAAVATVWDADSLNGFLENPKKFAPGTKMGFAGLAKAEDRANLIAYLDTIR